MSAKLVPGAVFKHYKNKLYMIKSVAIHTETEEKMVIYKQLYASESDNFELFQEWVRPKSMFLETVNINNKILPRFTYIGMFTK